MKAHGTKSFREDDAMTRRFSAIAVSTIVLLLSPGAPADEGDDFLRLLESHRRSIASFEIELRRVSFGAKLEDYEVLKKTVEQAACQNGITDDDARQWAKTLIQKYSENPSWIAEHTRQRGDRFKHIQTSRRGDKYKSVRGYDGCLHYDYFKANQQLDIYAKVPNIAHADLASLGFIGGGFRQHARLVSLERDQGRMRCAVAQSEDDEDIVTFEYDRHLALRHFWYESGSDFTSDNYYLFHRDMDGYRVPRIHVKLFRNARRKECNISIRIIDDARFNGPLTNQDLHLDELPDSTLVIDYRFEPKHQWRYSKYRQAAANPEIVHAGRCRAEDFIEFLRKTSGVRKAYATRNSHVGRRAPRLHLEGWPKESLDLNNWPLEKFTVLNFWAIGCGFCVNEVPENKELATWLEGRGALFLTIHSAAKKPRTVIDFLDEHRIEYLVGFDKPGGQANYWGGTTFAAYGIAGIPAYVTIAKDGRMLSYDRSLTKERLEKLMTTESDNIVPKDTDTRRPAVIPKTWLAHDLEPQSQIEGRFFVYRPETPDLTLCQSDDAGKAVDCQWTRHSADGQTVYDVRITAKAPDWGQTLEGRLTLLALHNNIEEQVMIPYKIRSKGLVEYISPLVWFGCVEPGATVTRSLPLQLRSGHKVEISQVSLPAGLKVRRRDEVSGTTVLDLTFSSPDPGLHQGELALSARDTGGHHQPISLEYCAFVQPQ